MQDSAIVRRIAAAVLIVVVATIGSIVKADHPVGVFDGAGGPINTIPGTTLDHGTSAFSWRFDYTNFNRFSDAKLLDLDARGLEAESIDYTIGSFLSLAHGLTDDVTVAMRLPYFYIDDIRHPHLGEVENEGDAAGLGDILGLASFRVMRLQEDSLHLSVLAGLEIPSGRTTDENREGVRFETEHQPGSGSWDPLVGLALTKIRDGLSFHASSTYTFNTDGSQDTNLGDLVTYNAALVLQAFGHDRHEHLQAMPADDDRGHDHTDANHHHHSPTLDLVAEINGIWEGRNRIGEILDDNSGGNLIYFSPGLRMTVGERWSYFFSAGIPIVQDVNGTNHPTDYRLVGGTSLAW